MTAITTNTAEIPDTVSGYVYERFKLLDSLPQNMTKAILGAWETWKLENPRAVYREACKQCGGNSGFDCWEKVTDDEGVETLHHFFAFCPACRKQREGHLYLTPRQWKERGVLVMPVGYKGGKLQFEADNGLRTVPEHNPHVLKSLKGLKLHMNRRTGYDRDLGRFQSTRPCGARRITEQTVSELVPVVKPCTRRCRRRAIRYASAGDGMRLVEKLKTI